MKYITAFVCYLVIMGTAAAHGIPEADRLAIINGGYWQYIWLGAKHMVTGYDHILFLVGVVFFLNKFTDIVKFVTAFTIGHSITLVFATFVGISVNYWLIDSIIALTVIFKAYDNIGGFKDYKIPNMVYMIFGFGLIHGLGLSTRLQQLPLEEFTNIEMLGRIISFNIGVELGQIAALMLIVPIILFWRNFNNFKMFSRKFNIGLMVIGSLLFIYQAHGYMHVLAVDELKFSEDSHNHSHEHEINNMVEEEDKRMEDKFLKRTK